MNALRASKKKRSTGNISLAIYYGTNVLRIYNADIILQ